MSYINIDDFVANIQDYSFAYDPEKDAKLRMDRGIGFQEVIALIVSRELIAVREHHNADRYPNQLICEVCTGGYVYVVPIVVEGKKAFVKTIYPSRKATRKHKKGHGVWKS